MSGVREALAEEYPDWHPEVQRLVQAHVVKLEAALRFYAERRNYRPAAPGHHDVPLGGWMEVRDSYDGEGAGARARAALGGDGGGA